MYVLYHFLKLRRLKAEEILQAKRATRIRPRSGQNSNVLNKDARIFTNFPAGMVLNLISCRASWAQRAFGLGSGCVWVVGEEILFPSLGSLLALKLLGPKF